MKVYFNASLAGKKDYLKEYRKIISIVKNLGHEIVADQVMNRKLEDVNKQNREEHSRDFQKVRRIIQQSDVMVVEGTYPSIGAGLLVGLALDMYKPVLILYLSTPHGLLLGDPNRLLTVIQYSSGGEKALESSLQFFLRRAKKKMLKYRFNFMVSKSQNDYLDNLSKKMGVSRAKVLRDLIDTELGNNSLTKK